MKMKMLLYQMHILLSAFSLGFKVTTVDNLDVFGLDLKEFAHEIQIAIQCSCTVSQSSSNKMQVVIQGNQIAFVADLLTGKIPFILCQQALHLMRISRLTILIIYMYINYFFFFQENIEFQKNTSKVQKRHQKEKENNCDTLLVNYLF